MLCIEKKKIIHYLLQQNFSLNIYFVIDFSVPFNWQSPFGYMAVVPFQLIGIISCSEVCVIVLCLFSGLCLVMTSFVADIESNLDSINDLIADGTQLNSERCHQITTCLHEITKFLLDSKE